MLINLSIVYERQKQLDKALDCLNQVLALDPGQAQARKRLEDLNEILNNPKLLRNQMKRSSMGN